MTVADDLRAARALIDTPKKWARGNGHLLGNVPFDKECALTAIYRVCGSGKRYERANAALRRQIPTTFKLPKIVHRFNDASSHNEVLALFDRAIANEEHHDRA